MFLILQKLCLKIKCLIHVSLSKKQAEEVPVIKPRQQAIYRA